MKEEKTSAKDDEKLRFMSNEQNEMFADEPTPIQTQHSINLDKEDDEGSFIGPGIVAEIDFNNNRGPMISTKDEAWLRDSAISVGTPKSEISS